MTRTSINWLKSGMLAGALALFGGNAFAADPPATADVLNKLHASDQKEIEAGKTAEKQGQSKEVRDYGKMLVKDHTTADQKVTSLAKKEKITLSTTQHAIPGQPTRARAPQLQAIVQAEREPRAHQPDELAVGEQRRRLNAGDAALEDDGQRGRLRVGRGGGCGAEQGEDR